MKSAAAQNGPLHVLIDSTGLEVFGAGQRLVAKHGAKSRRTRRKLYLAVDADNGMVVAQVLTDQHTDDAYQVGSLLMQIEEEIKKVIADGAHDGARTYQTIAQHSFDIEVVILPCKTAVPAMESRSPNQRGRHLEKFNRDGRLAWQKATSYRQHALVETTMGRYKSLIGPRLRSPGFAARQIEPPPSGALC